MAKQKTEKTELDGLAESIRAYNRRRGPNGLLADTERRLDRGTQKLALKLADRGVPAAKVRVMAHAYHERMLELRRLEEHIRLELAELGFTAWEWGRVRTLVRRLYALQRKYQCLTLARMWAYRATEATWDGLDPRAVRRLVYRCWRLMSGSNSLSDLRMLRQCMVKYMGT